MSETPAFAGFSIPAKNYFHMPNNWTDICAEIDNLAELKIVQYVLRHTWGFHEYGIPKAISVDEFMYGRRRADGSRMDKGTGLKSDRSVKDGIKAAVKHGYLVCDVDDNDKGRIRKAYALKMVELEGYNLPQVDTTPQVGNIYPSEVQHLPLRGATSTPRTEKDTLEKHLEKDTKKKSVSGASNDTPFPATHTPFENPSSSEQEETVPALQAHPVGTEVSTNVPRTSIPPFASVVPPSTLEVRGISSSTNSTEAVASHLPQGNAEKPVPPQPDKTTTNTVTQASVRRKAALLHKQWVAAYGPYGDAKWDTDALLWIAQQQNGTWDNVVKMYQLWEEKEPSKPIHPEMVKNKWFWLNEKPKPTAPQRTSIAARQRVEVPEDILAALKGKPS